MRKLISLILIFLMLMVPAFAEDPMIKKAKPYIPEIRMLIEKEWLGMPIRETLCGQVEQESSWNKFAHLHTSREDGYGLVQVTIAYDKNGKERFNNLREAAKLKDLREWNWKDDPYNTKYQLAYLILTMKSNYNTVSPYMLGADESMKSALVCYNAGTGRWLTRRTVAKAYGYRRDIWDGGLSLACGKEKNTILYNRDLCTTVNEYPRKIYQRKEKYKGLL